MNASSTLEKLSTGNQHGLIHNVFEWTKGFFEVENCRFGMYVLHDLGLPVTMWAGEEFAEILQQCCTLAAQ